ncbi:hypothetical protein Cfor_12747 [Coptotermes formosanus]|uniref:Thyroid transcription factor 1-associated protein 26 n=1 Tax=Coptotermes formosanus TaxID=36987 RepID=A0A6L2PRC3_COPFO|nr:hypothetical protein Cfor_12747 [Coptotermes formosanus]
MSGNREENKGKKSHVFNKKEWRRRKYSNKYKLEQWQERRRRAVLRSYYKELQKTAGQSSSREQTHVSMSSTGVRKDRAARPTAYQKAVEEYKHKQEEKAAKLKEAQKRREERSQALARYRANKAEVFRKLSMKTKKGQPVMKGRLEILLHKLQKDMQS